MTRIQKTAVTIEENRMYEVTYEYTEGLDEFGNTELNKVIISKILLQQTPHISMHSE